MIVKKKITAILLSMMMFLSFSAISSTVNAQISTNISTSASVSTEYKNALYKAKQYNKLFHMSKKNLYKQFTSKYGEGFSKKAATYAVNHVKANWNKNALYKAKEYRKTLKMSKNNIYKQLISSYGEGFTKSQAKYAIKHLK